MIVSMQLEELIAFIDRSVSDAGRGNYKHDPDINKRILANTLKLVEEVGELSSEILWHLKLQREEKLSKFTPETLQDEFGDTLISTLRLARIMNIDVQWILEQRVGKLKARIHATKK